MYKPWDPKTYRFRGYTLQLITYYFVGFGDTGMVSRIVMKRRHLRGCFLFHYGVTVKAASSETLYT